MGFENFWHPQKESKRLLKIGLADLEDEKSEEKSIPSEDEYTHEGVPSDLVSTSEIFEKQGVALNVVHGWYAAAIARRDRVPLESDRFVSHFTGMSADHTFAFGDREKGFLLGYVKYGVFIPTHFAPKTMRGGYELMKQLGENKNIPAVLSITEDLKDTLSKMPSWQVLDVSFLASFREELAEKKIVYNSHPDTKNLMFGLVSEYLEEAKGHDVPSEVEPS